MKFYFRFLSLTLLFYLTSVTTLSAQDGNYLISLISNDLSRNADAVIRKSITDVNVISDSKMLVNHQKIVSVLNANGQQFADFIAYYSDFEKIKNIKIVIYDASGHKIKSVKRSEIKDYSAEDGFSLYNDTRVLYYHYIPQTYPYTVAISYKVDSHNTASLPSFNPIGDFKLGIEQSVYKIGYPPDIILHIKEKNLKKFGVVKQKSEHEIYYKLAHVAPIIYEDYMPFLSQITPSVRFALNRFSLAGVKGHADSWLDFGNWVNEALLKGRNTVTPQTKAAIEALTASISDPVEKAKKVYKYMQNKTRYVSIQIGIGGWRPMPALEVDQKAYGDCKALVNYTKSLMDIAGVNSYYSLVYGGARRDIDSDLVGIQGNHAILMLPTQKDTIWLECTSQKVPFGFIAGFTDNRKVLVVKPHNSFIKKTTQYPDSLNQVVKTALIQIDQQLNVFGTVNIQHCGPSYDDVFTLKDLKKEKQVLFYKKYFAGLNGLKIKSIKLKDEKSKACFEQKLGINIPNYVARLEANQYYFRLNIFSLFSGIPPKYSERKFPVVINRGFKHIDHITIKLPDGLAFDFLPDNLVVKSQFGIYKRQVVKKGPHQIIYNRIFEIKSGTYPKESYRDFRKFLKKVRKLDLTKTIIKKI